MQDFFFNLWWFSARFNLPLPLPINPRSNEKSRHLDPSLHSSFELKTKLPTHFCAFAAWDQHLAEQGCKSAATVIKSSIEMSLKPSESLTLSDKYIPQSVDATHLFTGSNPLLSNFSLQSFSQTDWDNPDLSEILVSLVEATNDDLRDFRPVISSVLQCNQRRKEASKMNSSFGSNNDDLEQLQLSLSAEYDGYRTLLYLVRYQCTTAFHAFFPTVQKNCKGYHFWCAKGTPLPIFDRMYRAAVESMRKDGINIPSHEVSDLALAFRCVFGHII